ncbi:PPK2 family polyphosphate kinase [Rhodococcoides corynebacterioides]|uniref:Polyphosphate kinase 2 family protein n=1 Tax=Rhodococcoides corynebacterioides TaxID=53972 RepID=A0ABS7P587_9NOCA|nr:PPK2 family polyphosphate kinase [Rhodococcus corynebacterioides]MBY6367181.1 polyphosphate kinase 2 family protein [Rhodococcus corynebacterioides]MBY6407405.1 polyphosphate kinase 2 family protein [Rhodococcus corynebacterioides]
MSSRSGWSGSATEILRVDPDVSFGDVDTYAKPGFDGSKSDGKAWLDARAADLLELQEKLYANGRSGDRRSVLLVLQGMDTSGKGGIVKHVLGQVEPQGVDHTSFAAPTEEERAHPFLWRVEKALPRAGQIGVFDRSHYEDVLIVRVHDMVPREVWEARYDEINAFEKRVVESGTTLIKVALALSKDEQRDRLARRLRRPDKYWKFDPSDVTERGWWNDYMAAYDAVLQRTSTEYAPWHVVPCDRKWYSRVAITELLVEALHGFELDWPAADFDVEEQRRRLQES